MDTFNNPKLQKNKKSDLISEIESMQVFMYALIHDLKSPISNLHSLFNLLKVEDAEDRTLLMQKAETVINNMDITISKLNKLLILKNGNEEDIKKINLYDLLESLKESEIDGGLKDANLTVNFDQCLEIVYSESYLRCILSNLINNAVKYKSDKRPLSIHLCSQKMGEYVLLTVRDNGEGIDIAADGNNLFKPFKKLSNSKAGSRLGLYLVKVLVEKNGGHIVLCSTPNVGTTFTSYLKEF